MLPKENRLNKKYFQLLHKQGKKFRGEYGMLVIQKSTQKEFRFAFVVSKKIGNAVQRNRMTRLLREITKTHIKDGIGMKGIYIAYKYCNEYEKLEKDFNIQFETALRDTLKA